MVNPSYAITPADRPIAERLAETALLPTQPEPGPTALRPVVSIDGQMVASADPAYAPGSSAPGSSAWATASAMPGQEAHVAMDGEAALWTDIAIGVGFVCLAAAWFAHMRAHPSALDRTAVRRRPPPLVDLDEVLDD